MLNRAPYSVQEHTGIGSFIPPLAFAQEKGKMTYLTSAWCGLGAVWELQWSRRALRSPQDLVFFFHYVFACNRWSQHVPKGGGNPTWTQFLLSGVRRFGVTAAHLNGLLRLLPEAEGVAAMIGLPHACVSGSSGASSVSRSPRDFKACWACGSTLVKLKRCSKCQVTGYCTPACQLKHWRAGHKIECAELCRYLNQPLAPSTS